MHEHDHPSSTTPAEIEALITRLKQSNLSAHDARLLERLLRLLLTLINLVEHKNSSIKRLKRLLFGPGSETRRPLAERPHQQERTKPSDTEKDTPVDAIERKPKGHGRMPSTAYSGAAVQYCPHPHLVAGDACPDQLCPGHLYDTRSPSILIRLEGQPVVGATRYEQQVLRCSACQYRYTAPLLAGVSPQKYAATADVAIALAKYSAGVPFHRLAEMQAAFGVPLPESVQFERCNAVADAVLPVYLYLREVAARGQLLYSDDTRVKILSCLKENRQLTAGERRGLQTTGIVAQVGDHQIALYASGRRHAGENIDELLKLRPTGLPPPIQMADALSCKMRSPVTGAASSRPS